MSDVYNKIHYKCPKCGDVLANSIAPPHGGLRMPIVRWHGWGAQCRRCKQFLDLDDGIEAWKERDQVKMRLDLRDGDPIEDVITDTCGCRWLQEGKG